MTVEGSNTNIAAIQSLRGIAALMVVLFHLTGQTGRLGFAPRDVHTLAAGVDIFFVISGFIMWVTTASRPERTAGAFYRDRIVRIVPLYWAITAFMVAVVVAAPHLPQTALFDAKHAILSFLFVPALNPGNGTYTPLLIPGWTLNYEMFFYLLFGSAMAVGGRNMRLRAALIVAALVALTAAGWLLPVEGVARFYTYNIVLEFAFGIGLGMLYLGRALPRSFWWWPVAALGAVLLTLMPLDDASHVRAFNWGLPALLIVAGCVFASPIRFEPLEDLGDWSYALYLSHPIVLSAAFQGWRRLGGALPAELYPLLVLAACVIVSALLYHFVELPSKDWLKARKVFRSWRRNLAASR
jgi:exopolysaccharide production protein ExoZ